MANAATGPRDSVAKAEAAAATMPANRMIRGIPGAHRQTVIVMRDIRALKIGLLPGRDKRPGYSGEYSPNAKCAAAKARPKRANIVQENFAYFL
ncbi:hypothetical protein D1872_271640 [compost metagenome]